MTSSDPTPYLWLIPLVLFAFLTIQQTRTNKTTGLPPGPPTEPIIGHLRSMPLNDAWKTFGAWKQKYGDIIHLSILGRSIIVLNSFEASKEILEKKGPNNSDRPRMPFAEMMGAGPMLVLLPYGERWRRQRRFVHPYFNIVAIPKYRHLYEEVVSKLLSDCTRDQSHLDDHINTMVVRTIALVTYGHEVGEEKDRYLELQELSSEMLSKYGNPGSTPADLFPWLRHIPTWFPGAGFKRHAIKAKKVHEELVRLPYEEVKEKKLKGIATPCFVSDLLDEYEKLPSEDLEYEEDIKWSAFIIHSAGSETSTATLMTFFLMMLHHPEVVKRAQAEIDRVVGLDRLPTFDDRQDLPYVECVLKETLRINPPVPLGIPHRNLQPDTLSDFYIPGGSAIITNLWQIARDEAHFSDPESFIPERFEGKLRGTRTTSTEESNERRNVYVDDPSDFVFGFGRRICPGRHFAEAIIWLTISNVLATFDILPPIDPITGQVVLPRIEYTVGITSRPKPYKCRLVPRERGGAFA